MVPGSITVGISIFLKLGSASLSIFIVLATLFCYRYFRLKGDLPMVVPAHAFARKFAGLVLLLGVTVGGAIWLGRLFAESASLPPDKDKTE